MIRTEGDALRIVDEWARSTEGAELSTEDRFGIAKLLYEHSSSPRARDPFWCEAFMVVWRTLVTRASPHELLAAPLLVAKAVHAADSAVAGRDAPMPDAVAAVVPEPCPSCGGTCKHNGESCPACGGTGRRTDGQANEGAAAGAGADA